MITQCVTISPYLKDSVHAVHLQAASVHRKAVLHDCVFVTGAIISHLNVEQISDNVKEKNQCLTIGKILEGFEHLSNTQLSTQSETINRLNIYITLHLLNLHNIAHLGAEAVDRIHFVGIIGIQHTTH